MVVTVLSIDAPEGASTEAVAQATAFCRAIVQAWPEAEATSYNGGRHRVAYYPAGRPNAAGIIVELLCEPSRTSARS
jgi:hypothetical protein